MLNFTPVKSKTEEELLKQAQKLIEKKELKLAIELLEDALQTHSNSQLLISNLSNLKQQYVNIDITNRHSQKASKTQIQSVETPTHRDFEFLHNRSLEISEPEYSFTAHIGRDTLPTKKQCLEKQKHNTFVDVITETVTVERLPSTKANRQSESSTLTETNVKTSKVNPLNITKLGYPETIDTREEKTNSKAHYHSPLSEGNQRENQVSRSEKTEITDVEQSKSTILSAHQVTEKEGCEGITAISDFEWTDKERASLTYNEKEFDFFDDFNLQVLSESSTAEELNLYDYWDDEFDQEVLEENEEENGALENTLTLQDRAQLVAIECVLEFNWSSSTLSFLVELLTTKGWSNVKKALSREVKNGASFDELDLAYEVKKLWQDSSRYWITFSKVNHSGESTDATYRHCSWHQALRLIRVFETTPTFEEVYDFLEHEFEVWFNHSSFRKCFPSFFKYLFNYRLNERNICLLHEGFIEVTGNNDLSWSHHTYSDEALALNELGIDLVTFNTPKTQYLSDKYTFEYLLKFWQDTTPENEKGKLNEK